MNQINDFMGNRGSQITEKEIQIHKNKLNYLINQLISVHDVDEETSINNEIKVESECLKSLLNIKKKEIVQYNNMQKDNMNNNNFFNPMLNQNNMNNNQMMQQIMQNNIYINTIAVIFRSTEFGNLATVYCTPDEKISSVIDKYRNKSCDRDDTEIFIFNAKKLNHYLTVAEAGLTNNANIFVVKILINVIFRVGGPKPVLIECKTREKVSSLIEKYRNKSGDRDDNKKFIFNAKNLNLSLTVAEAGITNNANIFVAFTKKVQV